jgi:D-glycero-D-manno-heptose 1,7-bisphosphate phosphatase
MRNIDLVILAGGRGTRIKKLTNYPKPIVKFNNLHFLDYLLQSYSINSFKNIYVLAGFKGKQIKKIYDKKKFNLKNIKVIIETKPLDTGGALFNLKNRIKNNFVLTNGDSLVDIDIKNFTKQKLKKSLIKMALINKKFTKNKNKLNDISIYNNNVVFKKNSQYMNSGIYYCNKNLLKKIINQKISLENEIIPNLIKEKKVLGEILKNKFFLDIGTPFYFFKTSKILKKLSKKPAVFFDRDNTLIKDKGYTFKTRDLRFKKNAINAIKYLINKKYYIFLVTNQAGIAKGYFKEKDFINFQEFMRLKMEKKGAYFHDNEYCPYHPDSKLKKYKQTTEIRKPGNMMIRNLENKWLVNKSKSFMIGDSLKDKKTAKKSEIYFEYAKDNLLSQVKTIYKKLNLNTK